MKNGVKNKYIFGVCKVGEKGQIVIPKDARELFNIHPGDSVIILGDIKKGLAVVKTDIISEMFDGEKHE